MPETEQQGKTGYSLLKVKEATKARFDQLMQETHATTADELLALLIEHFTADQPKP